MAQFNSQSNVKPSIIEGDSEEYKRTQTNLVKDNGDSPSGNKMVDPRLPQKFKYQFGGQMGWVVIPKGRIVSIAPDKQRKSFDDHMYYPMVTLANGGQDVQEANDDPQDRQEDGENYTRTANKPVGVSQLNVYQDLDDQFAGNKPGFITRNTINLPYFEEQEDAEKTEWGSAYGADLKAGDKVKSDENGRFVKWEEYKKRTQTFTATDGQTDFQVDWAIWPDGTISVNNLTTEEEGLAIAEINYPTGEITLESGVALDDEVEVEYQSTKGDDITQIVGQIIKIDTNMVPAGWLKWVMPESDYVEPTGYQAEDIIEDGFPYDEQYMEGYGDGTLRPTGIPGLTDGSNVVVPYEGLPIGDINITQDYVDGETLQFSVRVLPENTPIEEGSLTIYIDGESYTVEDDIIRRVDRDVGLIMLEVSTDTTNADLTEGEYEVTADFEATHQLPGMPSNIDFEGVAGSVDILLQL